MTTQQAMEKLELARKKQRKIRKEIDNIREHLINQGHDPDLPKVDLVPRNKMIFKQWKKGKTFTQISHDYNLSTTRISSICHRIEIILQKEKLPDQYSDLVRYKEEE